MGRARDRSNTPGHPEAGGREGITNDPSWQETLPENCDAHRSGNHAPACLHEATGRLPGSPLRQRESHHGSHAPVIETRRGNGTSWDNRGMPGSVHNPHDLAEQVRTALEARDLDAFGALLSDDVRWGDDDHPRRCRSRSDVLATFRRLMDEGAEADITELVAGTNGLLCGLVVKWPTPGDDPSERTLFHVYLVRNDLIVEIQTYDDRMSAALAAGIA